MPERVLTRVHSLRERLDSTLVSHRNEILMVLSRIESHGKGILKPHQVMAEFEAICKEDQTKLHEDGAFYEVLKSTQEAIVLPPWVALAIRLRPGVWEYVRVNVNALVVEELSVPEYLHFKEELVNGSASNGNFVLELDFEPFTASFPRPTLTKSIGNGVEFLNRHLSAKMFHDKDSMHPLLDFLHTHQSKGKNMMLNDRIQNLNGLQSVLRKASEYLSTLDAETPYSEFAHKFQEIGLERGWGNKAEGVMEMIHMLLELLEAPDACTLEKFLGRISMVFNVVILSPHGYFAQENVLGYPDTGGQVVYILDQVPALEREMRKRIKEQGLDIVPHILIVTRLLPDAVGTTCGQRVPFRTEKGILRKWISRFEVWPYIETFTEDCTIMAAPDFPVAERDNFSTFLGRPWRNYSRTIVMRSYLGDLIDPQGWCAWNKYSSLDTVEYIEYMNFGPGADTRNRVQWVGYHNNSTTDVEKFTVQSFLQGANEWLKSTDLPLCSGLYAKDCKRDSAQVY
ncbi:Glycosyl transferase, family 1 [Artemisia annua]|uniref:sucrose synthase n=1 Tax=Artemisia annua TaxID=35608 RepID=A0A2U1MHG1_ARTAN|nr:Glycosyl transferase, family 1 [Artemisia annua]